MAGTTVGERSIAFEAHRGRLFGIAYRMLGTVTDAEDLLQDAWLKWSQVAGPVEEPAAYLARTVTNLALNRLTSAAVRRERYVGPWLPEPLVGAVADVADTVEQSESVSVAMLVVLETLSPLERAVFVLREVFDYPHREIAEILDRSEPAVRQLARRAKAHVTARRRRFATSAEEQRRVTAEFLAACLSGDPGRIVALLAPDVTVWTDGGGKVPGAGRHPVRGAMHAARGILAALRRIADPAGAVAVVNGGPGILLTSGGRLVGVATLAVRGGRVTDVYAVRNPDKLRHLAR